MKRIGHGGFDALASHQNRLQLRNVRLQFQKRPVDQLALGLVRSLSKEHGKIAILLGALIEVDGYVGGGDPPPAGEHDHAFHHVLQFPDISRPRVAGEPLYGLVGKPDRRDSIFRAVGFHKNGDQKRDVLPARAQRRHYNFDHLQPEVEILPKRALPNRLSQILVGGGEHPDIHRDHRASAHAHNLPFLQHPEQLHLSHRRHLSDLVEKQRPPVGGLEKSFAAALCAGKSAPFVTEQLTLHEVLRDRSAVDGHKRLVAPEAVPVDGLGDHLFAGTVFAHNQHVDVSGRDLHNRGPDLLNGLRTSDETAVLDKVLLRFHPIRDFEQPLPLNGLLHKKIGLGTSTKVRFPGGLHEKHHALRAIPLQLRNQLGGLRIRCAIHDEQIGSAAPEHPQRRVRPLGCNNVPRRAFQRIHHRASQLRVFAHHQDVNFFRHRSPLTNCECPIANLCEVCGQ